MNFSTTDNPARGKRRRGWPGNGSWGGFTLVELLVSTVCLLMLVVFLARLLDQANNSWIFGEANKERMQNERSVRDYIANELRGALLPANRANKSGLQLIVNPNDTAAPGPGATLTAKYYLNRDAIFWQAPLATDQTLGDVAEVGYFVSWDDDLAGVVSANPHARLCRFFVNPNKGAGSTARYDNFLIYPVGAGTAASWLTDTILKAETPADYTNGYKGLFAENVVGLWVRCLDRYGGQIRKDFNNSPFSEPSYAVPRVANNGFNSRLGFTTDGLNSYKSAGYTPAGTTTPQPLCALPAAVELSLIQLDSRSASRVGQLQKTAIQTLMANSKDVTEFIASVPATPNLTAIRGSLHAYTTVVYLQNAK